jgi:hypothetical protein
MKKTIRLGLLSTALLGLLPLSASAQFLRCKNETVNVGDLRASVLQRCGEPLSKDAFCKPVESPSTGSALSGSTVVIRPHCTNVDEWTYDPGPGQFMTTLQIESGKVTAIKYGDRVK